ncbi:MAG: hypothetical protein QOH69_1754 [Actinomycetota bacterium]|nr:hypothetical protein [Actinomycetota bacterium]
MHRAERAILASVGFLPWADMLEAVPPDSVVLDRDPKLGDDDVGPDLEAVEERSRDDNGVAVELELESEGESLAQVCLRRGRRLRGGSTPERVARQSPRWPFPGWA